jgi:hypothetical protein
MKTIQAVPIWNNGSSKNATILNAYSVSDNLTDSATFYYALLSSTLEQLAQGNLTMSGADYQAWQQNTFAWDWIASELNLTITGEYVPPVPPEPTTTLENEETV